MRQIKPEIQSFSDSLVAQYSFRRCSQSYTAGGVLAAQNGSFLFQRPLGGSVFLCHFDSFDSLANFSKMPSTSVPITSSLLPITILL